MRFSLPGVLRLVGFVIYGFLTLSSALFVILLEFPKFSLFHFVTSIKYFCSGFAARDFGLGAFGFSL